MVGLFLFLDSTLFESTSQDFLRICTYVPVCSMYVAVVIGSLYRYDDNGCFLFYGHPAKVLHMYFW